MLKYVLMVSLVAVFGFAGVGCKDDPEEPETEKTVGDEVEEAAEDTGDAIEEAGEDTEEAVDESNE